MSLNKVPAGKDIPEEINIPSKEIRGPKVGVPENILNSFIKAQKNRRIAKKICRIAQENRQLLKLTIKKILTRRRYSPPAGRNCGNKITSRIDGESVNSITNRSMPIPPPALGGSPYCRAKI